MSHGQWWTRRSIIVRLIRMVCLGAGFSVCAGCEALNEQALQSLLTGGNPLLSPNDPANQNPSTTSSASALVYDVDLAGYASGETTGRFDCQATIRVFDILDATTSGNVVEVIIESGAPLTSGELGDFLFATHTALYEQTQSTASVDLAFVNLDEQAGTVTLIPDAGTQAITNSLNTFIADEGLVQEAYLIDEGLIVLEFRDEGAIGGLIEVKGTGILNAGQGSYTATFSGWLRGSEADGGTDQWTG